MCAVLYFTDIFLKKKVSGIRPLIYIRLLLKEKSHHYANALVLI